MRNKQSVNAATIAMVELLWRKYPEMRLGQLLVNLANLGASEGVNSGDIFFLEDDKLVQQILYVVGHGWTGNDH